MNNLKNLLKIKEMPDPRAKIEKIKLLFKNQLKDDAGKFTRMLLREIDLLWREYKSTGGTDSLEKFADYYLQHFGLTNAQKNFIVGDLKNNQAKIAELYDDYFFEQNKLMVENGLTTKDFKLTTLDYNKIAALTGVSFPQLKDDIDKVVLQEIRRSVSGEYGYASMRQKLINKGLGQSDSATLANTSLAQFDNNYHIEGALQAGAEFFLYDGILVEHSRLFCIEHYRRVYTIEELKVMDNRQNLPVIPALGGYNCTHFLTALFGYVRVTYGEKYEKEHHKFGMAA